jgi:hypothetical protein
VVGNRERRMSGSIFSVEVEDWEKFMANFEQCIPMTPEEKSWPKRYRRF